MSAVLPGTTLARSAALARAIRADQMPHGDPTDLLGRVAAVPALLVAVEGLLTLARQGHGAQPIEGILAEVAEVLGIIGEDS